jgi:hypothetical protein
VIEDQGIGPTRILPSERNKRTYIESTHYRFSATDGASLKGIWIDHVGPVPQEGNSSRIRLASRETDPPIYTG